MALRAATTTARRRVRAASATSSTRAPSARRRALLAMARDLAPLGIRVCTVAPGIFETPMMAAAPDSVRESLCASIPFPARFGGPDEFAQLAEHIISNPYVNGETIRLDGAVRMQ